MALITTPGAVNANSYVSLAEAVVYFSLSYNRTAWSNAGSSDKEKSLSEATRLLDTFVTWNWSIASTTQSLRWPRRGATDQDGRAILDTQVPANIKDIVCELAYSILSAGGFDISDNAIDKIKVGPISVDFDLGQRSPGFTKIVRDAIAHWGFLTLPSSSSVKTARLIRT